MVLGPLQRFAQHHFRHEPRRVGPSTPAVGPDAWLLLAPLTPSKQPLAEEAKTAAENAAKSNGALTWQDKIAEINHSATISGSVVGSCHVPADLADMLCLGLDTAQSLIFCDERSAKADRSLDAMLGEEYERLQRLAKAQRELGLRTPDSMPLVGDRRLFALCWCGDPKDRDRIHVGLRFAPHPGEPPCTIELAVDLRSHDPAMRRLALDSVLLNLLHGAYFCFPFGREEAGEGRPRAIDGGEPTRAQAEELVRRLLRDIPRNVAAISPPKFEGPRLEKLGTIDPSELKLEHRADRDGHPLREFTRWMQRARDVNTKVKRLEALRDVSGVIEEIGGSQWTSAAFKHDLGTGSILKRRISHWGMEASALAFGAGRAVTEDRLAEMLQRNFSALSGESPPNQPIFAFANTVSTGEGGSGHGWVGLRFRGPSGESNEIRLHVRLRSAGVPDQELELRDLGINLIDASLCTNLSDGPAFVHALLDGIIPGAVDIDVVRATGPDVAALAPQLDFALLRTGAARALFYPAGKDPPAAAASFEQLYRKDVDIVPLELAGRLDKPSIVSLSLQDFRTHGLPDEEKLEAKIRELVKAGHDVIVGDGLLPQIFARLLDECPIASASLSLLPRDLKSLCDPERSARLELDRKRALRSTQGSWPLEATKTTMHVDASWSRLLTKPAEKRIYRELVDAGRLVVS